MPKRVWAAVGMLAAGAGLMATAAVSAPALKQGGIFRVGVAGSSVQIDPQVSYISTGWWLEYATAAKLFNYPDRAGQAGAVLRPEVASRYTVSKDGKTYRFTIRKGFRFSDGQPVTARNFAYAFARARNRTLGSPAATFIADVAAVRAQHMKLVIRLNRPDGSLLSTLALPFFQATWLKLPLDREVTTGYPSAGPYYFSRNEVNELTSLRRNPFWKRGPGRRRPRHLSGVDIHWNLNEQTGFEQVLANDLDLGPLPAAEVEDVARRFDVNKTRFWVKPTSCLGTIAFNNSDGLFAGNPALRKAVNWALDRRAYTDQGAPFSASPWTHILSPLTPGSVTARKRQPYTPGPNLAKARELAAGHFGDGRIVVAYRSSGTTGPSQAELVRRDLIQLGFKPEDIQMKGFPGGQIYSAMGRRGSDIDLFVSIAWCLEVPDPYQGLKAYVALDGKYARKLERANRLSGAARLRALGKLDLEIMRNLAPVAPMQVYNNRYLFSDRVDPRSLVYQPTIEDWSIPALALK